MVGVAWWGGGGTVGFGVGSLGSLGCFIQPSSLVDFDTPDLM